MLSRSQSVHRARRPEVRWRNVLKRHPNGLKRGRNGLKRARNYASFRQNDGIFPCKWLASDGLGLWALAPVINPCDSQDLRPIMGDDTRLRVANSLPELELRPAPISGENRQVIQIITTCP